MTFFENILKKRLGDATSSKGVAPDDLWAAIEQNLPPEEEKASPMKWGSLGLVFFAVVLAIVVSLSIDSSEDSAEVPSALAAESLNQIPETSPVAATVQIIEAGDDVEEIPANAAAAVISTQVDLPQDQQDDVRVVELPGPLAGVFEEKAQPEAKRSAVPNKTVPSPTLSIEENELIKKEIAAESIDLKASTTDEAVNRVLPTKEEDAKATGNPTEAIANEQTNNSAAATLRNTVAVRKLAAKSPITALERRREELVIEDFNTIIPVKQLLRPRVDFGVFVGTNMLRHQYPSTTSDDLADVLNTTRGEALGQSAALEVGYRLRPGLKVYTGVELLKTHTTFRYTQQWDTVTLRNGQQVDAIATRRVQHNNRQSLLSVPLMLEKIFTSGRWGAGLAAGVSFNYLTQQRGRSLNALQEVVSYGDGGGTSLPAPAFYMAYQLRPTINYRLNNSLSVQVRADLRWQRYGKSALYDLSANSMLYGGSFGLVFGL
jgi:hypothetical protein